MLTLPQNGGNRVSEDLKFQNFSWRGCHLTRSSKDLDPRQKPHDNKS